MDYSADQWKRKEKKIMEKPAAKVEKVTLDSVFERDRGSLGGESSALSSQARAI